MLHTPKSREGVPSQADETRLADGAKRLAEGRIPPSLSYHQSESLIGTIVLALVCILAAGFIFWLAMDVAKHLTEGK